jgi:hypothetical protein
MASQSSSGTEGIESWHTNRRLLPAWNERPLCKCGHRAMIDTWELTGPWHARRYFKCPDIDPDFMVWSSHFIHAANDLR